MAALSVERARLGKNTSMPAAAARDSKVARSSELAATPPETRMDAALMVGGGGEGAVDQGADYGFLKFAD